MSPPRITFTREQLMQAVAVVVAVSGAWFAVDARVKVIETQQVSQAETNREMKADIKEIRQDVQYVVRTIGKMDRRNQDHDSR